MDCSLCSLFATEISTLWKAFLLWAGFLQCGPGTHTHTHILYIGPTWLPFIPPAFNEEGHAACIHCFKRMHHAHAFIPKYHSSSIVWLSPHWPAISTAFSHSRILILKLFFLEKISTDKHQLFEFSSLCWLLWMSDTTVNSILESIYVLDRVHLGFSPWGRGGGANPAGDNILVHCGLWLWLPGC